MKQGALAGTGPYSRLFVSFDLSSPLYEKSKHRLINNLRSPSRGRSRNASHTKTDMSHPTANGRPPTAHSFHGLTHRFPLLPGMARITTGGLHILIASLGLQDQRTRSTAIENLAPK